MLNPPTIPESESPRWPPGTRVRLFRHDPSGLDDSGRPLDGTGEPYPTPIGTEGTVDSWFGMKSDKVWVRITHQKFPQLLVDRPWGSWAPV